MFALFKSDDRLEAEEANPDLRVGLKGLAIAGGVTVCCVVAALPFGDSSDGWNFIAAPIVAAVVTGLVARRGPRIRLAIAAMCTTFVLMALVVLIALMIYGL